MKQPLDSDNHKSRGYAMVVLLVFVIMAVTLISAAVNIMLVVTQSASQGEQSYIAVSLAETGVEEALLRSLRNNAYTGGPLTIGSDTVTISVEGTTTKTIRAEATVASTLRRSSAVAQFNVEGLTVSSWQIE